MSTIRDWGDFIDSVSDPRTKNWFLMGSPIPTILASLSYLYAVKVLGPNFMKNRKPFNIRKIQLIYNTVHLLLNAYMFHLSAQHAWLSGYSFRCQAADTSNYGTPLFIAKLSWWYYLSKFTDFMETIIFVLGKRYDLVNSYHVSHHSIMPISVWFGVKFLPGGHATFFGFLNVFVHIVIYSYLVLIAAVPTAKKYFKWWKTFLPIFQVAQFLLIAVHAFQLVFKNDCNFPMAFVYFIGGHGVLFYMILMYELKWKKSSKTMKEHAGNSTIRSRVKPMPVILNYDSFVSLLSSKSRLKDA